MAAEMDEEEIFEDGALPETNESFIPEDETDIYDHLLGEKEIDENTAEEDY